ncbi:hypothetical protein [Paenibacillus macerans]|uniref:hypothetical protein n=1 Tax=Paenibacillus macerans TaxID=44252 RepID=UPI002040596C|nr:hypothetical protein [Paenibacillus macerans]MCM3700695.1 hypothetical protein [Paenibacillus macerans]
MGVSTKSKSLFELVVCKNGHSELEFKEAGPEVQGGLLKCSVCGNEYLVLNNVILTSEELMSEADKQILRQLREERADFE